MGVADKSKAFLNYTIATVILEARTVEHLAEERKQENLLTTSTAACHAGNPQSRFRGAVEPDIRKTCVGSVSVSSCYQSA